MGSPLRKCDLVWPVGVYYGAPSVQRRPYVAFLKYFIGACYGAPIAQRRQYVAYWCLLWGANCAKAAVCGLLVLAMGSQLRKGGSMWPIGVGLVVATSVLNFTPRP